MAIQKFPVTDATNTVKQTHDADDLQRDLDDRTQKHLGLEQRVTTLETEVTAIQALEDAEAVGTVGGEGTVPNFQCGTILINQGGNNDFVTFPFPFATDNIIVTLTLQSSAGTASTILLFVNDGSVDRNGFSFNANISTSGGSSQAKVNWMASPSSVAFSSYGGSAGIGTGIL